jgi:uncharacterized protein (TIGR02145 family)
MKTMKKFAALLIAGMLLTNGANAQKYYIAIEDSAYVITNTDSARVGNSSGITLQWYVQYKAPAGTYYQSAQVIAACNNLQTCTVPANLCRGDSVRFFRKVISQGGCTGNTEGNSDTIIVTFKCGGGHGTRLSVMGTSVCIADRNVDTAGSFAKTPSDYGMLYQWNREKGWATSGAVSGWISTPDNASTWTVNPCPTGWRMFEDVEFKSLINGYGSTWAAANSGRGNTTNGRFLGTRNATCSLPNNMSGCIFLPAAGTRYGNGALNSQGSEGMYWSRTQHPSYGGFAIYFNTGGNITAYDSAGDGCDKAQAISLRCFQ